MAEHPATGNEPTLDRYEADGDADAQGRTLTDLIDEIGREAFSRSLAKRPGGARRLEHGNFHED